MPLVARDDARLSRLRRHVAMVRARWEEVVWLKDALRREDSLMFLEVWLDIPHREQTILYSTSTTGGGIWTTKERNLIREYEAQHAQAEFSHAD